MCDGFRRPFSVDNETVIISLQGCQKKRTLFFGRLSLDHQIFLKPPYPVPDPSSFTPTLSVELRTTRSPFSSSSIPTRRLLYDDETLSPVPCFQRFTTFPQAPEVPWFNQTSTFVCSALIGKLPVRSGKKSSAQK